MKHLIQTIGLTIIGMSVVFLLAYCGKGVSSNEYLGELPGIAKKYTEEIDAKKKEAKESTDMNEAFTLQKEYKNLKEEAKNAIKEYLANNTFKAIPFEQNAEYPFTIRGVDVNTKKTSIHTLVLTAKIIVKKNLTSREMREQFGGLGSQLIAYSKALDKDGKQIEKVRFVAEIPYTMDEFRVKEGQEAEMVGSISDLGELENFGEIIFITKEDFDKLKYKWEK